MNKRIASSLLFMFISTCIGAEAIDENKSPLPDMDAQNMVLLDVTFMKQKHMGCSRTAFAMVMHYYDPSVTLEMVEKDAPRAPDGGSQNNFMAVLAEQYGFKTHAFPGTIEGLLKLLQEGKPVIVAQYPSLTNKKCNHDLVVVGYDKAKKVLYVHDPFVGANIPISYDTFLSLWESSIGLDDRYYSVLVDKGEMHSGEDRVIAVDGEDADWAGMEPFSPDRADDTDKDDMPVNIKDVFSYKDGSFLYFKTNFIEHPKSNPKIKKTVKPKYSAERRLNCYR